jgi:hypothetical protein
MMPLQPRHSNSDYSSQVSFVCRGSPVFRAKHAGVLPTGALNLSNALPTALTKKKAKKDDDGDSDEERWGGKSGSRKGKTGIRNGFQTTRYDDDDDE